MNLSTTRILNAIESFCALQTEVSPDSRLNLGRPVFLTEGQREWPTGHVCLCEEVPDVLLGMPLPDNILVVCRTSSGRSQDFLRKAAFLTDGTPLPVLFNALQKLFDRYDRWEERLGKILRNEGSLSSMLDVSYPIFNNPLLLQSVDFSLIAHSQIIDETPSMAHLIDPAETFDAMTTSKLDPTYNSLRDSREPFFLPEYLNGCRELCVNIFEHGVLSCRLILAEETETIQEDAIPVLQHLAAFIQTSLHQMGRHTMGGIYPLDRLLSDIIDEKIIDSTSISVRLAESGWFQNHHYCCLAVRMTSLDSQNLTSSYLCRHIEEVVPGSCAFQHRDELVIFVNLTRSEGTIDDLMNQMTIFLRDSFLRTGVSDEISNVDDLRYSYLQAKYALDIGSRYQSYRWVHRFDQISVYYLSDCCIRDLPPHMVCSKKLLVLRDADRQHHSQYYETLRAYLETNQNATLAARRLFIHRSTFLYRLGKIQELVDIDFSDTNEVFYIMTSYYILDLRDRSGEKSSEPAGTASPEASPAT